VKRIRTLLLAALAALALAGVVGVSSASAAKFVSETEFTEFNGSGYYEFALGVGSTAYSCTGPAVSSAQVGTAISEGGASYASIASTSTSSSCSGFTKEWKSCRLTFHPPAAGGSEGSVEIGPSGCGPIYFKGVIGCEYSIPAQTGIAATYENIGTGTGRKIEVSINDYFTYTRVGNQGCGKGGMFSDGRWIGTLTLEGSDGAGSPVGIRVAQLPVGAFMTGEKSEEAARQPSFAAEEYPVSLAGDLSKEHRFQLKPEGTTLSCQAAGLSSSLPTATSSIDVNASYEKCANLLGQTLTVKMNSCHYGFTVANSGPPYTGTASVKCDNEGDGIEFLAGSICTYKLPAQNIGTATYSTVGSLNTRKIVAEVSGSGITYLRTYNGFFCPVGSEAGSFSGGFRLGGVE
jgi:hypothetical protein